MLNLQGTDTLFELLNDPADGVLANCPAADPLIDFAGGSSSIAETAAEGGRAGRWLRHDAARAHPVPTLPVNDYRKLVLSQRVEPAPYP